MLSHNNIEPVMIRVELDITGYGDWNGYQEFEVSAGETLTHKFPDDFNAYRVRTISNTDTSATAQFVYE